MYFYYTKTMLHFHKHLRFAAFYWCHVKSASFWPMDYLCPKTHKTFNTHTGCIVEQLKICSVWNGVPLTLSVSPQASTISPLFSFTLCTTKKFFRTCTSWVRDTSGSAFSWRGSVCLCSCAAALCTSICVKGNEHPEKQEKPHNFCCWHTPLSDYTLHRSTFAYLDCIRPHINTSGWTIAKTQAA